MGEVEAIGDAVSGALIAREVEPAERRRDRGRRPYPGSRRASTAATTLAGAYCHACGQRGHVHRTLTAFFHDLLHSVFHFEGRFWNTLPLLAWRPGELTRRYIEGQRARFVSPMALFLFSVFLMFAVVSSLTSPIQRATTGDAKAALAEERAKSDRAIQRMEGRARHRCAPRGDRPPRSTRRSQGRARGGQPAQVGRRPRLRARIDRARLATTSPAGSPARFSRPPPTPSSCSTRSRTTPINIAGR